MKPCISLPCNKIKNLVERNKLIQSTEMLECFYFETGTGSGNIIFVMFSKNIYIETALKVHFHRLFSCEPCAARREIRQDSNFLKEQRGWTTGNVPDTLGSHRKWGCADLTTSAER